MDRELEEVNRKFHKKNMETEESCEPLTLNFEIPDKYSDYDEELDCIVDQEMEGKNRPFEYNQPNLSYNRINIRKKMD
jgi:hypothetical protein